MINLDLRSTPPASVMLFVSPFVSFRFVLGSIQTAIVPTYSVTRRNPSTPSFGISSRCRSGDGRIAEVISCFLFMLFLYVCIARELLRQSSGACVHVTMWSQVGMERYPITGLGRTTPRRLPADHPPRRDVACARMLSPLSREVRPPGPGWGWEGGGDGGGRA